MTRPDARASYGVDAPPVLLGLVLGAMGAVGLTVLLFALGGWPEWIALVGAVYAVASALSYTYTTLRGKFVVWARS